MTEPKSAGATRLHSPRPAKWYDYICQLEEKRRPLAAFTKSSLNKGFRLCDVQAMSIHHVLSTCQDLTYDLNGMLALEQTQTDKIPPEDTIARFVSLLNEITADLALPYATMIYPGTGQHSS